MKITIELDTSVSGDNDALFRLLNPNTPEYPAFVEVRDQPLAQPTTDAPPAKRTRRTKAEITAAEPTAQPDAPVKSLEEIKEAIQQETKPEPPKANSFLDEDEAPEPTKTYTKDEARAALVALQTKRHGVHVAAGKSQAEAALAAEADAKKVMLSAGGITEGGLGKVDPSKYGAIVAAANKAAAE